LSIKADTGAATVLIDELYAAAVLTDEHHELFPNHFRGFVLRHL
jgi:hypothetical protein